MAREKGKIPITVFFGVLLVFVALFGIYTFGGGGAKALPVTNTGGSGGSGGGVSLNVSSCNPAPVLTLTAAYVNATTTTGVAGENTLWLGYNIILTGKGPAAYSTGNTLASGAAVTDAKTGLCGQGGIVVFTGNTFWANQSTFTYASPTSAVKGVVKLASLATLKFNNQTGSGFKVGGGTVHLVSNGQTLAGGAQIQVQVVAGQGWDSDGNPLMIFVANSAMVTSVSGLTNAATGQAMPAYGGTIPQPSGGYPAISSTWGFLIPPQQAYSAVAYNPTINLGTIPTCSLVSHDVAANALGVYLYSSAGFYFNGQGSLLPNQIVTPGTQTPINTIASNSVGIGFSTV